MEIIKLKKNQLENIDLCKIDFKDKIKPSSDLNVKKIANAVRIVHIKLKSAKEQLDCLGLIIDIDSLYPEPGCINILQIIKSNVSLKSNMPLVNELIKFGCIKTSLDYDKLMPD